MRILNFGSCNIDFVYRIAHVAMPGETIASDSLTRFPGGKGLNQSIAIARSGVNVCHAGCIGKDGDFLKKILSDAGTDVSCLKTVDCATGHAIIQVDDNAENSIILYHGSNFMVDEVFVDEVLAEFGAGDYLMLQNEISCIPYIIDRAYQKCMQIVLNPSPFNEVMKQIDLNMISVLVLNEIEAFEFTGCSEPEKICDCFAKEYKNLKIVLTLGSKGCVYADANTSVYCPAYCVKAVDTTAAGDTFSGYYISGLMLGMNQEKILKRASAAAALAVSKKGAATSIPKNDEVEQALTELTPRVHDGGLVAQREKHIKEYIKNNIANADLAELASDMGYSETYLSAWIRKNMDTSFSELLQKERCSRAAQLLKETDLPISEIILKCGYSNGTFFRKIFRKFYAKAPFEYRSFYQKK